MHVRINSHTASFAGRDSGPGKHFFSISEIYISEVRGPGLKKKQQLNKSHNTKNCIVQSPPINQYTPPLLVEFYELRFLFQNHLLKDCSMRLFRGVFFQFVFPKCIQAELFTCAEGAKRRNMIVLSITIFSFSNKRCIFETT